MSLKTNNYSELSNKKNFEQSYSLMYQDLQLLVLAIFISFCFFADSHANFHNSNNQTLENSSPVTTQTSNLIRDKEIILCHDKNKKDLEHSNLLNSNHLEDC